MTKRITRVELRFDDGTLLRATGAEAEKAKKLADDTDISWEIYDAKRETYRYLGMSAKSEADDG